MASASTESRAVRDQDPLERDVSINLSCAKTSTEDGAEVAGGAQAMSVAHAVLRNLASLLSTADERLVLSERPGLCIMAVCTINQLLYRNALPVLRARIRDAGLLELTDTCGETRVAVSQLDLTLRWRPSPPVHVHGRLGGGGRRDPPEAAF